MKVYTYNMHLRLDKQQAHRAHNQPTNEKQKCESTRTPPDIVPDKTDLTRASQATSNVRRRRSRGGVETLRE